MASTDAAPGASSASSGPQPALPALPWRLPAAVSATVALLLARGELSRLADQFPTADGRRLAVTSLTGLGALLGGPDGWHRVAAYGVDRSTVEANLASELTTVLILRSLLGVLVVAAYAVVLTAALNKRWPEPTRSLRRSLRLLGLAATIEALVTLAFLPGSTAWGWLASLLLAVTWARWVALLLVLATLLDLVRRHGERATVLRRRAYRALRTHRFSLLTVLPVAVMSLVPGGDILDQLPDIQRAWASNLVAFGAAAATLGGVGLALFVLGRMRSTHYWTLQGGPPTAPWSRTLWLVGPVLALALAAIAHWCLDLDVEPIPLAIFTGVPLAVLVASRVVGENRWPRPPRSVPDEDTKRLIMVVGDLVAVAAVSIGALALVRAFTLVAVLPSDDRGDTWLLLATGIVAGVGCWPAARMVQDLVTSTGRLTALLDPRVPAGPLSSRLSVKPDTLGSTLLLCLGAGLGLGLAVWVDPISENLGPVPVLLLSVLSISLLVGGAVIAAQPGGSPPILWGIGSGIASPPIATMLVVTLALSTFAGRGAPLHDARVMSAGRHAAERPRLNEYVESWLAAHDSCGAPIPGSGLRIRPVALVAAEGGGIRAAYWSALGMDALNLTSTARCGDNAALVGTGASGGSVGLSVAQGVPGGHAAEEVTRLATPTALSAAVIGLLLRDLTTGLWGAALPRAGGPAGEDRAALIEEAWEGAVPSLRRSFVSPVGPLAQSPTGALVLGSTAVATGCRVLVSQLDLVPGQAASADAQLSSSGCTTTASPIAGSIELLGLYGRSGPGCLPSLRASTAAMLSARFPFVTPSGIVGPCPGPGVDYPRQQLVDGGYVENSGIGTIDDLTPDLLDLFRRHNDRAVAAGSGTVMVPVLVYLDNGPGSVVPEDVGETAEPLVPVKANQRAARYLSDTPTLLQRARDLLGRSMLVQRSSPGDTVRAAMAAIQARPVFVVSEAVRPQLEAPLGWALSSFSMTTMRQSISDEVAAAARCPAATTATVVERNGYGTLAQLLCLFAPMTRR